MESFIIFEFFEKEDYFIVIDIYKGVLYIFRFLVRNKVGFGEEMVKEIFVLEEVLIGFF